MVYIVFVTSDINRIKCFFNIFPIGIKYWEMLSRDVGESEGLKVVQVKLHFFQSRNFSFNIVKCDFISMLFRAFNLTEDVD